MHLLLSRSHRRTLFGGHKYTVSAQLDASPEDRAIIKAHDFSRSHIYTAPIADELIARADAHHEQQKKLSIFNADDQWTIAYKNWAATALYLRAAGAFHITVAGLLDGCDARADNLPDILAVEAAITDAFEALSRLVAHAHSFDQGSETVLVPDDHRDKPELAAPATWPDFARR